MVTCEGRWTEYLLLHGIRIKLNDFATSLWKEFFDVNL